MEVTTSIANSSQYVPEQLTKHEGSSFNGGIKMIYYFFIKNSHDYEMSAAESTQLYITLNWHITALEM